MVQKQEQLLKDVTFANWNNFYNDLFNEIDTIRKVGNICLFNPAEIKIYYTRIYNLLSSVSYGVEEYDIKRNKLRKIGDFILLKDLTKTKHEKIYYDLSDIFAHICFDLSRAGLLPKVNVKKKYDPNKAIMNTNY